MIMSAYVNDKCIFSSLGSPAERAALCIGDELLEVNGMPLLTYTHMEVISTIHKVKCMKR